MPTLIRLENGQFLDTADRWVNLDADAPLPSEGDVILPLARFEAEGGALLDEGRSVGVLIQPDQAVEGLAYDLPRLALVALAFPRFRDGRAYSSAVLLRSRFGFKGEVRAVGEVLCDQARDMVRCGFNGFAPSDGSDAVIWAAAVGRYRHVYQAAADRLAPAFIERERP